MKNFPLVVGIVGGGVVGSALYEAYNLPEQNVSTLLHDVVPERSKNTLLEVLGADVVLLCLPTPANPDGIGLDVSSLDEFCKAHAYYKKVFIIKSTVPVGTTRRLATQYGLTNLYHFPEFLSEKTAVEDARSPRAFLIGSPYLNQNISFDLVDLMVRLMDEAGTNEVIYDSSEVTEMAKLAMNAFYGAKVAYFNEVFLLCEKLGLKYDDVRECLVAAGRVGYHHTGVPGPDGMFGFGGKCLPKDMSQFVSHCLENKVEPVMSCGALARSAVDRQRKVKRWRVETVVDADTPLVCQLDNGRETADVKSLPHRLEVRDRDGKSPCRCVLVPLSQEANGTSPSEASEPSSQEVGAGLKTS